MAKKKAGAKKAAATKKPSKSRTGSAEPTDDAAPGWDAIDAQLHPIYGDEEPRHYAAYPHYAVGGNDPLDGISAYPRAKPTPHWHYVTYGFSELYRKESSDPKWSGFGFELTFRLAQVKLGKNPPTWPLNFLQNLARYVFRSGNAFAENHYMSAGGPIALGKTTEIHAIALTLDPELKSARSPFGKFNFLQVVGVTLDELSAIKGWTTTGVLGELRRNSPLLITDLKRKSITRDAAVARRMAEGARRDGSNTAGLRLSAGDWSIAKGALRLTLGANGVRDIKAVLPGRIPHGEPLSIVAAEKEITLEPGKRLEWREKKDALVLKLPPAAALALAEVLEPKAGLYHLQDWPRLSVQVEKSVIKDTAGKVVEVIG